MALASACPWRSAALGLPTWPPVACPLIIPLTGGAAYCLGGRRGADAVEGLGAGADTVGCVVVGVVAAVGCGGVGACLAADGWAAGVADAC